MNKSIELVLADHPGITMAAAEVEAGRRWDRASSEDCLSTAGGLSAAVKCAEQSDFIRSSLGPAALGAIAAADECAKKHCPQGGRCIGIDATGKELDKPTCSAKMEKQTEQQ